MRDPYGYMASQPSLTLSFRLTRDLVSVEIDGVPEDDTQKLFLDRSKVLGMPHLHKEEFQVLLDMTL